MIERIVEGDESPIDFTSESDNSAEGENIQKNLQEFTLIEKLCNLSNA